MVRPGHWGRGGGAEGGRGALVGLIFGLSRSCLMYNYVNKEIEHHHENPSLSGYLVSGPVECELAQNVALKGLCHKMSKGLKGQSQL